MLQAGLIGLIVWGELPNEVQAIGIALVAGRGLLIIVLGRTAPPAP